MLSRDDSKKMRHSYFYTISMSRKQWNRKRKGIHNSLLSKMVFVAIFLLAISLNGKSSTATCLSGKCHTDITATKYLHGPVAAEKAGVNGCIACHVPAGKNCTQEKKGVFKPLPSPIEMCQICHARGTGTQHSNQKVNCLKCHDPHGSDKNAELNR